MSPSERKESSPGAGNGGSIWLTITKPLSILNSFISKYISSSNHAPLPPLLPISSPLPKVPPLLPISPPVPSVQQRPDIKDLHPITKLMQDQELGKNIITLAIPIAAWVVASNNGSKLIMAHVVAVGLMIGCMAIWNGILFRANFPRLANILEQVGISLILLLIYGLVASFLPIGFSWILWLSGASCVVPFIVARFRRT